MIFEEEDLCIEVLKKVMLSHLALWENACAQSKTLVKEAENKLKRKTWQNRCDYSMRLLLSHKMKT